MNTRVYYFEIVRDIPYSIWHDKPDYNCVVKNDILANLLESNNLETRRRICKFKWDDLNIPESVLNNSHPSSSYHEFVEVKIPEKDEYITVDPSWDSLLSPEFDINTWDGKSDTDIAVKPIKIYSVEESKEIRDSVSKIEEAEENQDDHEDFYYSLNIYLNSIREK